MVKQRIRNLVIAALALSTSAGCLGPLSYRPHKAKAVAAPAIKKEILPPAPDMKANDATLVGIDTTGVGVRDDVHIWVFTNYSSQAKRMAMMEIGKAVQAVLAKAPKTADEAKGLQQPLAAALLKLEGVPGITGAECQEIGSELYLTTVNTPARSKAYLQYSMLAPAESWTSPTGPALAGGAALTSTGASAGPTVAAAAPVQRPLPGVTPGYGISSVYEAIDDVADQTPTPAPQGSAAATPTGSIIEALAAAAKKSTVPAIPRSNDVAVPAATPTAQTAPETKVTPVAAETKVIPVAAATPPITSQADTASKDVPVPAAAGTLAPPPAAPIAPTGQATAGTKEVAAAAATPKASEAPAAPAALPTGEAATAGKDVAVPSDADLEP